LGVILAYNIPLHAVRVQRLDEYCIVIDGGLAFILLAYLTPDTTYQVQNFEQQTQMQSSGTEVVTQG